MTPSTCCFCAHANPAGSKFCNECASPLHLKPCRRCNAVNAREAQTCYRCDSSLHAVPTTPAASPERIVAEADETLAALRRELDAAPLPEAILAREPLRSGEAQGTTDAGARPDPAIPGGTIPSSIAGAGDANEPAGSPIATPAPPEAAAAIEGSSALEQGARPSEERRAAIDEALDRMATTLPEPTFDARRTDVLVDGPPSGAIRPGDREWRPERGSRALALAAVVALIVVPVAAYVFHDAAILDEWLGRTSTRTTVEPASTDAAPSASTTASPPETLATSPAAESPPGASPGAAAADAPPATGSAAGVEPPPPAEAAPPVAAPAESVASPDPPAAVARPPEREAKAAPAARTKGATAKSRPRERASKPRAPAPGAQPPRSTAPSAATSSAPRPEPCSEAVIALGLCNR